MSWFYLKFPSGYSHGAVQSLSGYSQRLCKISTFMSGYSQGKRGLGVIVNCIMVSC